MNRKAPLLFLVAIICTGAGILMLVVHFGGSTPTTHENVDEPQDLPMENIPQAKHIFDPRKRVAEVKKEINCSHIEIYDVVSKEQIAGASISLGSIGSPNDNSEWKTFIANENGMADIPICKLPVNAVCWAQGKQVVKMIVANLPTRIGLYPARRLAVEIANANPSLFQGNILKSVLRPHVNGYNNDIPIAASKYIRETQAANVIGNIFWIPVLFEANSKLSLLAVGQSGQFVNMGHAVFKPGDRNLTIYCNNESLDKFVCDVSIQIQVPRSISSKYSIRLDSIDGWEDIMGPMGGMPGTNKIVGDFVGGIQAISVEFKRLRAGLYIPVLELKQLMRYYNFEPIQIVPGTNRFSFSLVFANEIDFRIMGYSKCDFKLWPVYLEIYDHNYLFCGKIYWHADATNLTVSGLCAGRYYLCAGALKESLVSDCVVVDLASDIKPFLDFFLKPGTKVQFTRKNMVDNPNPVPPIFAKISQDGGNWSRVFRLKSPGYLSLIVPMGRFFVSSIPEGEPMLIVNSTGSPLNFEFN